uniref:Protein Wnt n=1 Tax=Setaria digitata TaxID=48799 RepID=A0A915PJC9_9BILA
MNKFNASGHAVHGESVRKTGVDVAQRNICSKEVKHHRRQKVYWIRSSLLEVKGLLDKPLYRILQKDPALITVLKEALQDTLFECSRQSVIHRWKCNADRIPQKGPFSTVASFTSKEFAYFLALSSAAAVRAIAHACARGRLRSCSCDPARIGPVHADQRDTWARCSVDRGSDNLRYAIKLSKRLIDRQFVCSHSDKVAQIYLHNIAVGRSRVSLHTKCYCVSAFGSCRRRHCEAKVISFETIGNAIMESLLRSRRIRRSNNLPTARVTCLRPRNERSMRRKMVPLWFIDTRNWTLRNGKSRRRSKA